ncbi:MAG: hypothetical protein EXX96DRAFT_565508 [Benjaminiella poitrasii]|nr:MAG: hypothetical protein EXX96DRAFT_565508 [Benjaminiella poitrasii]
MSTLHLSSFFSSHYNKKDDNTTCSRSISKRSTITLTSKLEWQTANDKLQRSSTLSRVKRFGSMLMRSNKRNVKKIPSSIDTSLTNIPSSASVSSTTEDSEEEQVVTPTEAKTMFGSTKDEFMIKIAPPLTTTTFVVDDEKDFEMVSTVTPKEQANHQLPATVIDVTKSTLTSEDSERDDTIYKQELSTSIIVKPDLSKLKDIIHSQPLDNHITQPDALSTITDSSSSPIIPSTISFVRSQLRLALQEVDTEIEQEFEWSHNQMILAINAKPRYVFNQFIFFFFFLH